MDELSARPEVKNWAQVWVRNLLPLLGRRPPHGKRRVLVIFLDGLGGTALDRGVATGKMPFLARLLESRAFERSQAFSGIPSTTTAFQAGLFYGLRHPDIPGFCWLDRETWQPVMMGKPEHAEIVEKRLAEKAGPGFFREGTTYLSILRGGARNFGSTAGLWPLFSGPRFPPLIPGDFVGGVWVHLWTAARVLLRALTETPFLLHDIRKFARWSGRPGWEGNYILNHTVVSNLLQEMGRSQVLFDLVRGVPRMFYCIHDYDEVSHRRGPEAAKRTLSIMDRRVEHLVSVAALVPDPPDIWIITDHGQIPAVPFESIFGCDVSEWLHGDGSELPSAVREEFKVDSPSKCSEFRVVESGNYAHVYFSKEGPLLARDIVMHHGQTLARALDCPGIGLVAMRTEDGAIAFAGGKRVDPRSPSSIPHGVEPRALQTLLDELPLTPSSGDLVLFGSWLDDSSVAFTREFSSHGGISPEETTIFLLHPPGIESDLSQVGHGADLHPLLSTLYGWEPPKEAR